MPSPRGAFNATLPACAPLPAIIIGVVTMHHVGVSTSARLINVAATAVGLSIWFIGRRLPPPTRPATGALLAAASIFAILLPFVFEGIDGVYRWISVAGLRLHASAIAAPLVIMSVAAAAVHRVDLALAVSTTAGIILALQPDAAQAISLAAACTVVFVCLRATKPHQALLSVALMVAIATVSFARPDPLPPVAHVEGIFAAVMARGSLPAAIATVALILLPVPFFVAWHRTRRPVALALGAYVVMTLLAPAWGTFPVPVMGYGASPILGYFIALVVGLGGPARVGELPNGTSSSSCA